MTKLSGVTIGFPIISWKLFLLNKLKSQGNLDKNFNNGMLRHSFLRGGKIFLWSIFIVPSFNFLICLSVYLVLDCLLASTSEGRDGNKGINEQDRQTNRAKS